MRNLFLHSVSFLQILREEGPVLWNPRGKLRSTGISREKVGEEQVKVAFEALHVVLLLLQRLGVYITEYSITIVYVI